MFLKAWYTFTCNFFFFAKCKCIIIVKLAALTVDCDAPGFFVVKLYLYFRKMTKPTTETITRSKTPTLIPTTIATFTAPVSGTVVRKNQLKTNILVKYLGSYIL